MFLKVIIISFLLGIAGWFKKPIIDPIQLDEVSWVNHSYIYTWRKNQNWENFTKAKNNPAPSFSSPYFLLFDQPHLPRYIYGFVLDKNKIQLWQNGEQEKNYQLFVEQKLGGKILLNSELAVNVFGRQSVEAIKICRQISWIFALAFFLVFFLFVESKFSLFSATVASFFLITNPTIFNNFRLATADSIINFFSISSIICFDQFFNNKKLKSKNKFIFFIFSAIFTALAASSKINAWIIPFIFIIINLTHKQKSTIKKTLIWLLIFIASYIYLQPELWSETLLGLYKYFSLRLNQQERFIRVFGTMNLFEYHFWLIELFLNSKNHLFYILKLLFLIITLFSFCQRKKHFNKKLVIIFGATWIFSFIYARIAFDRYAIWPLIILSVLIAKEWQEHFLPLAKNIFSRYK